MAGNKRTTPTKRTRAKPKMRRKRVSMAQQQELSKAAWESQAEKKLTRKEMFKKRKRQIEVISRRTQPQWKMTITAQRLKKQEGIGGMVSSSWIASLEWKGSWVLMIFLNGYWYNVYIPFRTYEAWYYAHSKGTFFNYMIKGKYKVVRSA